MFFFFGRAIIELLSHICIFTRRLWLSNIQRICFNKADEIRSTKISFQKWYRTDTVNRHSFFHFLFLLPQLVCQSHFFPYFACATHFSIIIRQNIHINHWNLWNAIKMSFYHIKFVYLIGKNFIFECEIMGESEREKRDTNAVLQFIEI